MWKSLAARLVAKRILARSSGRRPLPLTRGVGKGLSGVGQCLFEPSLARRVSVGCRFLRHDWEAPSSTRDVGKGTPKRPLACQTVRRGQTRRDRENPLARRVSVGCRLLRHRAREERRSDAPGPAATTPNGKRGLTSAASYTDQDCHRHTQSFNCQRAI
jgi:hypothetical protein